eukprot:TRINITY_DN3875_c0_g1_i1.p1 TRINITY_DN3875_c0_g1~~TRINITY_DN3875_c0_g1_i1.p1  ORF type:complete len:293 (+),score=105.30 TRINITY_DN3875_c0_g1_i1:91-879(+)
MASLRGVVMLVLAMLTGVAAFSSGAHSTWLSGSMSAGLRMPAVTSSMGLSKASYQRSGAASTVMMPIGVPKVAYRVPGAPSADWVDIYNRLYRERIIFLGQEIDDELANQIIGVMLYLDSEDSTKPIYMYVNCPGGSVIAGLAIYDTMQHIKSEVITINMGMAASMASFLLAAGAKGKRMALPHSRVMIHQPMGGAQGQAEDIKVEATQIMRIRDNIVRMYAQMSGRTQEEVTRALDRDNFMSAQAALEFGLIDQIIELKKE